jgi:periplasmic divalent cation tolerance protein
MNPVARDFSIVLVMAANEVESNNIAKHLVEEKLAACVNIVGPVRSIYRWRGAIEKASECLLLIKTATRLVARVERRVRELHSYEVPEVVAVKLDAGSKPYLAWIADSTIAPPRDPASPRSRQTARA